MALSSRSVQVGALEGDDGLVTAVEPVQSLAAEHIFPELYAVFAQQHLSLIQLLGDNQPEPLVPAQGKPLMHSASVCTSKRSAIAREERRIGHLPPRTEARRLSMIRVAPRKGLWVRSGEPEACTNGTSGRGGELGVGGW